MKTTARMNGFSMACRVAALAMLLGAGHAVAQLQVRVSVKFILSSTGNRPSGGALNSNAEVQAQIDAANTNFAAFGRGYQYVLTEVVDLSGVSQWFNVDVTDNKDALELVAEANKATYAYRDNAMNVYVNNDQNDSGICSFPGTGDDIVFIGQSPRPTTIVHESGHYFNLYHTHQGEDYQNSNGSACTNKCACAVQIGGTDDLAADTLADHQCWGSKDAIAQGNFGVNYANLSAANKTKVDNIWSNIMSYHPEPRLLLTSDQLDRYADAANGSRHNSVVGYTRFVDRANNTGFEFGTSGLPYNTVLEGVNAAVAGDVVLIRPGNYNQALTITKAVTLRATRGTAIIGIP